MTIDRVAMKELLEKGSDQDLLREMLAFVAARMMDVEVESLTGAAHGERSPERTNQRNGYRNHVPAQIRVGGGGQQRIDFRCGFCFDGFVSHYFLQPRMRSKNTHSSVLSVSQRKMDMIATKANT